MYFKVSRPLSNAVAVTSFSKGDRQGKRLDSGEDSTEDVGHAVSCLYFCGDVDEAREVSTVASESDGTGATPPQVKRSGALRLTNITDGKTSLVEAKKDRLVCWRSKDVQNEILEVLDPNESQFAIRLWLHGCISSRENVRESIGRLKDFQKSKA